MLYKDQHLIEAIKQYTTEIVVASSKELKRQQVSASTDTTGGHTTDNDQNNLMEIDGDDLMEGVEQAWQQNICVLGDAVEHQINTALALDLEPDRDANVKEMVPLKCTI